MKWIKPLRNKNNIEIRIFKIDIVRISRCKELWLPRKSLLISWMTSKLEWMWFNINYRRLKSIRSHRMLKRINLERTLFRNKEKHLPKRKAWPNSREIFQECSRISIESKHWMQLKNKVKTIFKIYYKRKTFSRTIITIYILKNFTRKNKLI